MSANKLYKTLFADKQITGGNMSYRNKCEKLYMENIELRKQLEEANQLIDELLKKEEDKDESKT
jgi:hypothetical protein